MLDKFNRSKYISESLYNRIKRHVEENLKKQDYLKEKQALLESLPPTLKVELMKHTHGVIIDTLNFFQGKSWNFIWTTVPLMR